MEQSISELLDKSRETAPAAVQVTPPASVPVEQGTGEVKTATPANDAANGAQEGEAKKEVSTQEEAKAITPPVTEDETFSSPLIGKDEDIFAGSEQTGASANVVTSSQAQGDQSVHLIGRLSSKLGINAVSIEELEVAIESRALSLTDLPPQIQLAINKGIITTEELQAGSAKDASTMSDELAVRMDRLQRGMSPEKIDGIIARLQEDASLFDDEAMLSRERIAERKQPLIDSYKRLHQERAEAAITKLREAQATVIGERKLLTDSLKGLVQAGMEVDGVKVPKEALLSAAKVIMDPEALKKAFFGSTAVGPQNLETGFKSLAKFFASALITQKVAAQEAQAARASMMTGAGAAPAEGSKQGNSPAGGAGGNDQKNPPTPLTSEQVIAKMMAESWK